MSKHTLGCHLVMEVKLVCLIDLKSYTSGSCSPCSSTLPDWSRVEPDEEQSLVLQVWGLGNGLITHSHKKLRVYTETLRP